MMELGTASSMPPADGGRLLTFKRLKRMVLLGLAAFLLAVIGNTVWALLPFEARANQAHFKTTWTARLRTCHTLQDFRTLPQPEYGHLDTRVFADGSWVAISWHCLHDGENEMGNEWDGAVLRDSAGQMYWTRHHFCGYEGFGSEVLSIKAGSVQEFYRKVTFPRAPIQ